MPHPEGLHACSQVDGNIQHHLPHMHSASNGNLCARWQLEKALSEKSEMRQTLNGFDYMQCMQQSLGVRAHHTLSKVEKKLAGAGEAWT